MGSRQKGHGPSNIHSSQSRPCSNRPPCRKEAEGVRSSAPESCVKSRGPRPCCNVVRLWKRLLGIADSSPRQQEQPQSGICTGRDRHSRATDACIRSEPGTTAAQHSEGQGRQLGVCLALSYDFVSGRDADGHDQLDDAFRKICLREGDATLAFSHAAKGQPSAWIA